MAYIECKCPICDGEVDDPIMESFDDTVEDAYTCEHCNIFVVFVFRAKDYEKEWHVAPPIKVYTEAK